MIPFVQSMCTIPRHAIPIHASLLHQKSRRHTYMTRYTNAKAVFTLPEYCAWFDIYRYNLLKYVWQVLRHATLGVNCEVHPSKLQQPYKCYGVWSHELLLAGGEHDQFFNLCRTGSVLSVRQQNRDG